MAEHALLEDTIAKVSRLYFTFVYVVYGLEERWVGSSIIAT